VHLLAGEEAVVRSEVVDSPLIKKRGDENQFMIGVRISYEFGY
jgi:outer membrane scaffolding protein for murein synthesis (MipA/OmpV family)